MTKDQKQALIGDLTTQMEGAAQKLDFETAANLRDAILELQGE
ncbi:UvrB/UvrC motif-containing protein [Holzapfeliella floricola]